MSTLSQFAGGPRPPKVLINSTSTTGSTPDTIVLIAFNTPGIKRTSSGVLTAATLATVLTITGSGVVNFVACEAVDATSRTHRYKCTIDGVVVYDATTTAAGANSGIVLIGSHLVGSGATYPGIMLDQIPFNSSFLLEYASSLSETNKTTHFLKYRTQ